MWLHRLTKINTKKRTAYCAHCGLVRIMQRDSKRGTWKCIVYQREAQRKYIQAHPDKRIGKHNFKYKKYRKDHCERCGFKPEHPCQLDGHHRDGNHENNRKSNIQTLCANCHRLTRIELC